MDQGKLYYYTLVINIMNVLQLILHNKIFKYLCNNVVQRDAD